MFKKLLACQGSPLLIPFSSHQARELKFKKGELRAHTKALPHVVKILCLQHQSKHVSVTGLMEHQPKKAISPVKLRIPHFHLLQPFLHFLLSHLLQLPFLLLPIFPLFPLSLLPKCALRGLPLPPRPQLPPTVFTMTLGRQL